MKYKSFLFFISLVYLFCGDLIAGNIDNKSKELSGLKVKIKQISQVVTELKTHKQSLHAELKRIEIKYGQSVRQLTHLEKQIDKLKLALKKNKLKKKQKQKQIEAQKKGLGRQVQAAYGMGKNEKLKLMLNQQDPALSGRVMVYYDYLNKVRLKKISGINQDLQVLRDLDVQRHKESVLLEEKLRVRKQSQLKLAGTKADRQAIFSKISKQFQSKSQQLSQFKKSEKQLASLILELQQADVFPIDEGVVKEFAKLKGALPWPVKGLLVKKFGAQRADSRWDGVLIKAKEGREVRAVTRGQVVYADWLRGYGLLTIIKHDKGYMTLYAFNQSLYKAKGDWVDAGTVVSTVGLSGGRGSAGLYFGIRRKGKPVNPIKWCRKIRQGKTR